jgi:ketosteroid isomerase-like protein
MDIVHRIDSLFRRERADTANTEIVKGSVKASIGTHNSGPSCFILISMLHLKFTTVKTQFTILAMVILFAGCSQRNGAVTDQVEDIDIVSELAAIEKLRQDFILAIKEGRYDDLNQFVSPEAKVVGPGADEWTKMYALAQERGVFPYDSIIMHPTETVVLNETMAYDWGTSSVYYTDQTGNPVELKNSFLVLLKKEDGEWKLFREVGSSRVE